MKTLLLGGLAAAALVAFGGAARADEKKPDGPPQERGFIKAIDTVKGTLHLRTAKENAVDLDLNLTRDVKVVIEGRDAKPSDLTPGMLVVVRYNKDTLDVSAITAEAKTARDRPKDGEGGKEPAKRAVTRGVFKTLDAAKNEMTVGILRDGGRQTPETFAVTKETTFHKGKETIAPADLKEGTEVTLWLTPDRKAVVKVVTVIRDGEKEK